MARITSALLVSILLISFFLGAAGFSTPETPDTKEIIINPPEETDISVELWTERSEYPPGEAIRLFFQLTSRSYVYIYNIDTEGRVNLLFPNRFDRKNYLQPGVHELPGKGYSLVLEEGEGYQHIQAFVSKDPIPIFSTIRSTTYEQEAFPRLSVNPEEFRSRLSKDIQGKVPSKTWDTDWIRIRVTRNLSSLSIDSLPWGAKVYLDGELIGRTPLTASVKPGKVKVRIDKEGYSIQSRDISLGSYEHKSLRFVLQPQRYARLTVETSPPGGRVYVNGKLLGTSPVEASVEAGTVEIEVRKAGYLTWARELQLSPEQQRNLRVTLEEKHSSPLKRPPDGFIGLGANIGGWGEEFSAGIEISLGDLLVGASMQNTGDRIGEELYFVDTKTWTGGDAYNFGPQTEFYVGYLLKVWAPVHLRLGAGIAFQARANLAPLTGSSRYSLHPAIVPRRNAYLQIFPRLTYQVGLESRIAGLSANLFYHNTRNLGLGLTYRF